MAGAGLLNFFRVLIEGAYLTELRVEEALLAPAADGITLTWLPTIRRHVSNLHNPHICQKPLLIVSIHNTSVKAFPR